MIGLIGYQEDAIGFGLAGIQHIQEVPPGADKQTTKKALQALDTAVEVLIIPPELHRHIHEDTTDYLVIEIPQSTQSKTQEINALSKELLGIQL